jgi:hypothetical protein
LEYDAHTSRFLVSFPATDMVVLSLNLTDEFCTQMGYSGVFAITKGLNPDTAADPAATPITDVQKNVYPYVMIQD